MTRTLLACTLLFAPVAASAQSLTLGDIVASVEYARRISGFTVAQPVADAILMRNVAKLGASRVLDKPLREIVGDAERPSLLGMAKEQQSQYDYNLPDSLAPVLDTIVMVVNGELRAMLQQSASEEDIARIRAPFDSLLDAQLVRSLDESAEKLRRFEIMYGPGSVRLNLLEAGLNFAAQWLPGFGVDARGGPKPFELIAAYAPTYLTFSDGDARTVSVAETGVRMYIFRPGWGGDGRLSATLKPRHVAFGWAFTGPEDVSFRNPWKDHSRSGPFLSWGDIKIAYVTGSSSRLLVTRQLRFIPLVF